MEALKYSDAVLGGEGGTLETFQYALQEQRSVLPVQSSGGDAVAAFRDCLERWEMLPLRGFPLLRFEQVLSAPVTHPEDARDVAQGVLGLLVTLTPGAIFEQEIRHATAKAQVGILLVSDAFLNSTFIQEKELPWLRDRQASGSLTIMWVPVQGEAWRETSLAEILSASDHVDSALDNLSMAQQQDEMVKIKNSIAAVLETDRRQRT